MPLPAIVGALLANGLPLIADAVLSKGKEYVEGKIGVKLPSVQIGETALPPEIVEKLKLKQIEHKEFLVNAALEEKRIDNKAEADAGANVTQRWQADMSSDNKFSKNIRPGTLAWWTVAITLLIIIDSIEAFKFSVDPAWIELIKLSYTTILAAYFVGRSWQHVTTISKRVTPKVE